MAGPIDELLASHDDDIRSIVERLRDLLGEACPDALETVDLPDHLLAYGWTVRMRDLLFAVAPHSRHVNLQLADGAQLSDPSGVVEGTGKRIRHVKCRSLADAQRPALRKLVDAQIAARPRQPA